MRIVYTTSEVAGFAKTGGLADVASALPRALALRGHQCRIIMPLYRCVRTGPHQFTATGVQLRVPIGDEEVRGSIWQTTLPGSNIPVYLIEQEDYFERDDPERARGLYNRTLKDGSKVDYPDNCVRFTFFSRAILEAIDLLDWDVDVLHNNDWQTGLCPVYLREVHTRHPRRAVRRRYQKIRTVFTIHNIAYQGVFWHYDLPLTGLPWSLFNYRQLEFYGRINLLKAGIVFSDAVTTVSPTYAREIQTATYGAGLQGVLLERQHQLSGIVNGVDYSAWNPATDRYLPQRYSLETVRAGKAACKRFLQKRLGMSESATAPLLGMVTRLVAQKGLDLVLALADELLGHNIQMVILGEGDLKYHEMLEDLQQRHPGQVGLKFGLDEELAHQIEGGADVFLMPSLFEPCGLNQMYSLKYGTVPVVRATGGLADTVTDTNVKTLAAGKATGFTFGPPGSMALREALRRALTLYREQPETWLEVQLNGMRQDWSWERSAAAYERVYEDTFRSEVRGREPGVRRTPDS